MMSVHRHVGRVSRSKRHIMCLIWDGSDYCLLTCLLLANLNTVIKDTRTRGKWTLRITFNHFSNTFP